MIPFRPAGVSKLCSCCGSAWHPRRCQERSSSISTAGRRAATANCAAHGSASVWVRTGVHDDEVDVIIQLGHRIQHLRREGQLRSVLPHNRLVRRCALTPRETNLREWHNRQRKPRQRSQRPHQVSKAAGHLGCSRLGRQKGARALFGTLPHTSVELIQELDFERGLAVGWQRQGLEERAVGLREPRVVLVGAR